MKKQEALFRAEDGEAVLSARAGPVTVPSSVTPETPLEQLNLNWRERDLPERERTKHVHRLHPYLGKFIPQLVEVFVRKYLRPGQTVLDPFCGSGTTLVQANELGINSVGYDISAFNVLLSRAKTHRYELDEVRAEVLDILARVRDETQRELQQGSLWNGFSGPLDKSGVDSQYLVEWFAPRALAELMAYRRLIFKYKYQDILKVVLSRSARSARLTTHFDLDFPKRPQTEAYWCYKHRRKCYPTTEAFKFLTRYSYDTVRRLREFAAVQTSASVEVRHADSRSADFPPVDAVITSPPYVGLIDYHEQHAYAYHLLGLEDNHEAEIGAALNGSSARARERYQSDIAKVLRRARDAMPRGSPFIVVVADRAGLYGRIARLCELGIEGEVRRKVDRRTGRRAGDFFESVFIWRKP